MLGRSKKKTTSSSKSAGAPASSRTKSSSTSSRGTVGASSSSGEHKGLGAMLIEQGVISEVQLEEALAAQKEKGGFLGQLLVEMGFVKQDVIVQFLVKQCKIPHLSLLDYEINKDVLEIIPRETCLKHNLLPIDKLGRILTVAMVDPLDTAALEEIRKKFPDLRIKPILCNWQHFKTVSAQIFGGDEDAKGDEEEEFDPRSFGLSTRQMGKGKKPAASKEEEKQEEEPESPKDDLDEGLNNAVIDMIREAETPASPAPKSKSDPEKPAASLVKSKSVAGSDAINPFPTKRSSGSVKFDDFGGVMLDAMASMSDEAPGGGGGGQAQGMMSPQQVSALLRQGISEAVQGATAHLRTPAPNAGGGSPSPQELAEIISQGVGSAMQEVMATMNTQAQPAAIDPAAFQGPSPQELSEIISQGVGSAMQESMAAMMSQMRPQVDESKVSQAAPSPQELAEIISQGVGSAMQEVVSGLNMRSQPAELDPAALQAPSPQELAEIISQGVGSAMQESMAAMATQMRPTDDSAGLERLGEVISDSVSTAMLEGMAAMAAQLRPSAESNVPPERLAAIISEGVGTAMQDALITIADQKQTSEDSKSGLSPAELAESISQGVGGAMQQALAAMAETMKSKDSGQEPQNLAEVVGQTVREVLHESEAEAVATANRRALDIHEIEKARRLKHASVSALSNGKGVPADPDAVIDADNRVIAAMVSEDLLAGYAFDTFCVGKSNMFTYKMCQAVAANPGEKHNPFFLYGDVGLGKTHLINAIGNEVSAQRPEMRIGYISASRFASRLGEAQRDDAVDAFRQNYCHWDMLILDDVQFLGGRVEAQEEFFHIFNVLQQEGRQIIIAGDKAPDRLGMLERRLVSRFDSGVVTPLKAPEWDTRLAILKSQSEVSEAAIGEDVLAVIAMRVTHDVRKMIGALRKVVAYAEQVGEEVTCEMATEILSHLGIEEAA